MFSFRVSYEITTLGSYVGYFKWHRKSFSTCQWKILSAHSSGYLRVDLILQSKKTNNVRKTSFNEDLSNEQISNVLSNDVCVGISLNIRHTWISAPRHTQIWYAFSCFAIAYNFSRNYFHNKYDRWFDCLHCTASRSIHPKWMNLEFGERKRKICFKCLDVKFCIFWRDNNAITLLLITWYKKKNLNAKL